MSACGEYTEKDNICVCICSVSVAVDKNAIAIRVLEKKRIFFMTLQERNKLRAGLLRLRFVQCIPVK